MSSLTKNQTSEVEDEEIIQVEVQQVLSYDGRNIFILVNHVVLSNIICLFGFGTNIVNIVVFLKQGLRLSMNLCFFVLAVTDFFGLLTQLWHNFCLNPYVIRLDAPVDFSEVQFLTAGSPNACLVRITGWITVYITAERCLSIALPLKIKQIVTFERTAAILVFIYLVNIAALAPLYFASYFVWKPQPGRNSTMLGVGFASNIQSVLDAVFVSLAVLALLAFSCAIILTSILIINLKQKSKWRQESTSDKDQGTSLSSRDKKTIRMVTVVASVMIFCYFPASVNAIVSAIVPGYSITGQQSNSFEAGWSFAFLLHSVNSSVTMLLYYKMSSKYRATFQQVFPWCVSEGKETKE